MIYNGKEKRQKLIDILDTELHGLHCCFYILQQCNPCLKYIHNEKERNEVTSYRLQATSSCAMFRKALVACSL